MRKDHYRLSVPATLLVVALLLGTGCTDSATEPHTTTPGSAQRVDLPYNPDPPKAALLVATMMGDPELDGGCVWLRQGNIDLSVLWPEGFTAEFNPVRVYDGDNNLVAQEGEEVSLSGTFAADATAYQPHRCVVGSELWLAGQVEPKP